MKKTSEMSGVFFFDFIGIVLAWAKNRLFVLLTEGVASERLGHQPEGVYINRN